MASVFKHKSILRVGDIVTFIMPGFCTGNYTYTVLDIVGKTVKLSDNAPTKILDNCFGFTVVRKGRQL